MDRRIQQAFWETRDRGMVVLARDWRDNTRMPPLLLDPDRRALRLVRWVSPPLFARRAGFCINGSELMFVLWPDFYPNLDWEDETMYVGGDFNSWNEAVGRSDWRLWRETHDGQGCLVLRVPCTRCVEDQPVRFKFVTAENRWQELPDVAPNRARDGDYENYLIEPERTGLHVFYFWPEDSHTVQERSKLVWDEKGEAESCFVTNGEYLLSMEAKGPLGALVEPDRTVFRLFAPRADRVNVLIFTEPNGPLWLKVSLNHHDDGCWEAVVPKNLHGYFYEYRVEGDNFVPTRHFDPQARILDPYALAAVGRTGPGIVIDQALLPPSPQSFTPPAWHDLIILETHVRDLLAAAPIELTPLERRGFAGLTKWLRQPDCYLRELGINCVELQPVQEFDCERPEDYHWGYMPVNYFSPASAYATAPEHGSQIAEFREMVEAFHAAGLAVILDVVYNHVGEPNHLLSLDKYYYLGCDYEGHLTNWSGCGNDLRTSTPMARRLIIDSLIHFVRAYDVDGFRFDLADLVGVGTLREVETALKAVKPSIILIAEPWSFKGHIGHALRHTGWSSWNDGFREFVTNYVLGRGDQEGLRFFMAGSPWSLARWPAQTVNYVQSHDDRAWLDRITENPEHRGDPPTRNDERRHRLMVAILMASLGIPMLAQGQDFLQSKQGAHNTYLRGDLNALDYQRIAEFPATNEYFRHWIKFRLSPAGRHFRQHRHPPDSYFGHFGVPETPAVGLLYNADYSEGPDRLFFAINPLRRRVRLETFALNPGDFKQIADHERFHPEGLDHAGFIWRNGHLELPAMSVGLWQQA